MSVGTPLEVQNALELLELAVKPIIMGEVVKFQHKMPMEVPTVPTGFVPPPLKILPYLHRKR
jgi:hypothetical protein